MVETETALMQENWVFSLSLPSSSNSGVEASVYENTPRTIELVSFNGKSGHEDKGAVSPSTTPSTSASTVGTKCSETKSLLENEFDEFEVTYDIHDDGLDGIHKVGDNQKSCWQFYSSIHCLALESSTLLRLSYKPAWQSIPEYTKGKRQRALSRLFKSCCRSSGVVEQIWEVYSTKHIHKTEKVKTTVRGMGTCQAVRVYLKPLGDLDLDHMSAPKKFKKHLELHQQRANNQEKQSWTRFTEPEDTLSDSKPNDCDECIVLTFAVPIDANVCGHDQDPPLLWKVDIPPHWSDNSLMLDTITVMDGKVDLQEPPTAVYIEGYQSWSFTGSVSKGQPQPTSAMPNMFSGAFNLGGCLPEAPTTMLPAKGWQTNVCNPEFLQSTRAKRSIIGERKKRYKYTSDFFACITTARDEIMDENGGPALVCGWLSQHKQFGVVSIDNRLENVKMHATHEAMLNSTVSTDWAYAQLITPHRYDEEPMVHYLHAAAAYNQAKPLQNGPLLTGWCSWYHYYENITEENLRSNFSKLTKMKDQVPTNMVMVDDGYMTSWGDWDSLKPKKFTTMNVVAEDIASSRMRPGLWMAPFAADKHSKIAKNHPEWIIKNERGRPANSSNCGKFFYGLDATNPQVREHVFHSIRKAVHDWGFRVLKIDFLYAACLEGNGKYDMTMTRAEAMHLALQTIREAAGSNVFLIGCGCPMATGIGYIDGMRVSADTGPTWYPEFPLPRWDNGTLPSLRGMIRNSMSRAPMGHRWWQNDPDCLLLGESTKLTNEEVASAASIIAMTCGMLLVSDDLTKVSEKRLKILSRIFPMTGVSGVVLDLHTAKNKGMPSLIRLWCTDRHQQFEKFRGSQSFFKSLEEEDFTAEATHFGKQSAFDLNKSYDTRERTRSCINVARGMGTWTVISLSNWSDTPEYMRIPRLAIESPPETGWGTHEEVRQTSVSTVDSVDEEKASRAGGYHVFSTWSGRYKYLSLKGSDIDDPYPITRRLLAHETEIFHIRKVTPSKPQYIGSDIHFSCGHEVASFDVLSDENSVTIRLKTELKRAGQVYLFVPVVDTTHVGVTVGGKSTNWSVICNVPDDQGNHGDGVASQCCGRIIRITVEVNADGSETDGEIVVNY
jgi:alpha-galactosidase